MHDIFKWNYVVSCPIHLPHLWLDRKISMSYFLGQAHSHIYWQSQIILKCRGYIIFLKRFKNCNFVPHVFIKNAVTDDLLVKKKCTISSCYVIKENSFFLNYCMPEIEDWIVKNTLKYLIEYWACERLKLIPVSLLSWSCF